MSRLQIGILATLWATALLPILIGFLMPARIKVAAYASIVGFFPGIGAGVAVAGVWLGIAGMKPTAILPDLAFILAASPAVCMLGVFCMFIQASREVERQAHLE